MDEEDEVKDERGRTREKEKTIRTKGECWRTRWRWRKRVGESRREKRTERR